MNFNGFGRKQSWHILNVLSWNLSGGTEEIHEKPQDSRSPGRNLNPGHPEYEVRVLITRLQRPIFDHFLTECFHCVH
jgi:hypothetical protein